MKLVYLHFLQMMQSVLSAPINVLLFSLLF